MFLNKLSKQEPVIDWTKLPDVFEWPQADDQAETKPEPRPLPELREVHPNRPLLRRPETPTAFRELTEEEFFKDVPDDESTASDLTDPFEDLHHHCFLKKIPGRRRRYTKQEADNLLMNSFTEDFKRALNSVKNESGVPKYLTKTDIKREVEEALSSPTEGRPMSDELFAKFQGIPIVRREDVKEPDEESEDEGSTTIFDGMSPIWKMLATGQQKYFATPPGFNAYQEDEPHWLTRENVPWEQANEAKTKCENWLQRHSEEELLPPIRKATAEKRSRKFAAKK